MDTGTARVDKWLWSVRVFHTRADAARACRLGHIEIDGHPAKPSRDIRPGDVITAHRGELTRTLRVRALPPARIGAKLVAQYADDLTPPEEYVRQRERAERARALGLAQPPPLPGARRPTKRERRTFDDLFRPKG